MVTLDAWVLMLVLLGLLVVAFVPRLQSRTTRNRALTRIGEVSVQTVSKWYWVLLSLAFAVGIFIRLWCVPELPNGIYQDSAMSAAEALSLLRTGADQYGHAWPLYFEAWGIGQTSVLLAYLTIPFLWLFGMSALTIRLPILILSLLAMPVFWDLCRRILGKNFALLALWMLAICPWHIVQSRWSIDCNVYPHILLFAVYFLYLGLSRRPFLYLSMIFFGLTLYAYGVALYTVPFFLLLACCYMLHARRIRWWEALLCLVIFLAVAAPFLLIMAINTFEWDTMRLGPFTLPRFYDTTRNEDILFFSEEPFAQFLQNLKHWLDATLLQDEGDTLHVYYASRTLYPFSIPVLFAGLYLVWQDRRKAVLAHSAGPEATREDGLSLMFFWMCAALFCGILTNSTTTWRANVTYYPLLFCLCYGLWQVVRRVKGFTPIIALIYALGFSVFCFGYFHDASYIQRTAYLSRYDMYGALRYAHTMDCDRFYITTNGGLPKAAEVQTMIAHEIDGRQLMEEDMVKDGFGEEIDYYSFRYIYTDFTNFTPDPTECSAYIISQEQKALFPEEDFLLTDFAFFATAYPRCWAED